MKPNANKLSAPGLLAVICYLLCTIAAIAFYKFPYSPLTNWLSDLGDTDKNPNAWIYNIGILTASFFMLLFFIGFRCYRMENHRIQKLMVALAQGFGVMGSIAMAMSAIFPINHIEQHRVFSISLYVLFGTAFIFSVAALRYWKSIPTWILILGITAAVADIISSFFGKTTWMEWIVVILILAYLLGLSITSRQQKLIEPASAAVELLGH